MANELTVFDQLKQNDLDPTTKRNGASLAAKLSKGKTVYKRNTGMALRVVRLSVVNGIEHYNLVCLETSSRYFLSKFALERDYTEDNVEVEKFGLRMVKRLSKMLSK